MYVCMCRRFIVIKKNPPSLASLCLHQEEQCLCYCFHHPACSLFQTAYKFDSLQVSDTTVFWTNNLQWWEPSEFKTHSFLLLAETTPVTNHVRKDVVILWHTSLLWCLKHAPIGNVFETCTVTLKQSVLFFIDMLFFHSPCVVSTSVTVDGPKLSVQIHTCFHRITSLGCNCVFYRAMQQAEIDSLVTWVWEDFKSIFLF